jgi:hypothetical protein
MRNKILIAEGDDRPETFFEGLGKPLRHIRAILEDSELFGEEIPWKELTKNNRSLARLASSVEKFDSHELYRIFDEIRGCSIRENSWGGDSPGRSGFWVEIYATKKALEDTKSKLSELASALRDYWQRSGHEIPADSEDDLRADAMEDWGAYHEWVKRREASNEAREKK